MKRCIICFSIVLAFILLVPTGVARAQKVSQTSTFQPYWNLNLNGGTSLFFGDIKQNKIWPATYANHSEWRMGAGLMFGRQFTPFFGLRLQGLYGQLSGIKTSINEYMQGDYYELNVNGTFNLNSLFAGYNPSRRFNIYLVAGIGLTNYNTTIYQLSTAKVIAQRGFGWGHGIDKRTLEGVALGGLGISYRVSNHLNVNIESSNHFVNSDNMDKYVGGFKYDSYNYTSIGLTIKFGGNNIPEGPHQIKLPKQYKTNKIFTSPVKPKEIKPKPKVQNPVQKETNSPVQPPEKVEKAPKTIQKAQPVLTEQKVKEQEPVRHIMPVKPILEYRVQIRARYERPVLLSYLSKRYHIAEDKIRTNRHDGYYIYTVGSFDTYEQAKKECQIIKTQNGVSDAFVVAFKNGRRLNKLP